MDGQSLVAEFESIAAATRMKKELAAFLTTVAKEFDKAAAAAGQWPEDPTRAALALGKKYGVRWTEPMTWGADRLAGNEPETGALGSSVALFHPHVPGGFGAELPAVLKKAGAKVRAAERPPLVFCEVPIRPSSGALVKKLATWFEQRLGGKDLGEWTAPPWSRRALGFGHASDAAFVLDDEMCRFILPLCPSDFEPLRVALAQVRATVRIARVVDEKALAKRELAAAGRPKAAPKKTIKRSTVTVTRGAKSGLEPAAGGEASVEVPGPSTKPSAPATIPQKLPIAAPMAARYTTCFSTGAGLYAASGRQLVGGNDATKLEPLATVGAKDTVTSLFVDEAELWVAGNGLWRSTNGGKTLKPLAMPPKVDPDFWGKEFHGVAKDASGVVWAGGTWVVTVRGDKVVHEKSFGDDARIKSVVRTPSGVLLLTFTGLVYLANDSKAQRLPLRGKGHLSAACVTPRGTLIVVGSGAKWSAEVYRSEDGGATFKAVRTAKLAPLNAVAAFPDGRLVAGGGTLLLCSTDDGKTWKPVKVPSSPAMTMTFDVLCRHGDQSIGKQLLLR